MSYRAGVGVAGEQRRLQYFRLGLWLLAFSASALVFSRTRWALNSVWASAPLLIGGMLFLVRAVSIDWRTSFLQLGRPQRAVFALLIGWCVVTIIRGGADCQWRTIRDLAGIRYAGWTWVIPVMMLFGMNLAVLHQLLRLIISHTLLGVVLFVVCRLPPLSLHTAFDLTWGSAAALLFWHYLPRHGRLIVLVGAFVGLISAVLYSARNEVLGMGLLMIAGAYIEMRRHHPDHGARQLGILILLGCVLGSVYYVATRDRLPWITASTNAKIQSFKNDLAPDRLLSSRINRDRDYSLYAEFFDDMSAYDLLFGRGAMGYYKVVRFETHQLRARYQIECGYLQVVLKGGATMLFLMLGLAVPAAGLGLFRSRNWFVKGFACVVLGWLVEMAPFGLPIASPRYLLFWIAIGACLNPRLRMLTDYEIENALLDWSGRAVWTGPARWNG